jgi:hypothetical protein
MLLDQAQKGCFKYMPSRMSTSGLSDVDCNVLVDHLVLPCHIVFLVQQGACVAGCMLLVAYVTQTSSPRHVHVLNSVHRCFMLNTINTGTQSNVTLVDFVGVRVSVFATQRAKCKPCW